jgi:protein-tyrosine phosphatase
MGVSRSSSIVIAYLIKHYGMTMREARLYVKERRMCIKPNDTFIKDLRAYEERIKLK